MERFLMRYEQALLNEVIAQRDWALAKWAEAAAQLRVLLEEKKAEEKVTE